ncbi:unnamed protein product [Dimorphilus gyrociliatus]|uniref:EIPR1-like beta-propeller domain-containing protein n=1 Tax=Dimorphilus gyrociliatus TaxID=2664684 RepID=A0A7I8VJ71_9ANNE|nr:unnamed protein product [Dimorphilus gyrociliatus]
MEDEMATIYGLEYQCRCLTPQLGETDLVNFMAGTQNLKRENQVYLINYDDINNILTTKSYPHKLGEIWHIAACSWDKTLFSTVFSKTQKGKKKVNAVLWKLPNEESNHNSLIQLSDLNTSEYGDACQVMFSPDSYDNEVITLVDSRILYWDIGSAESRIKSSISIDQKLQKTITSGKWCPHQNHAQVCTASETSLKGWDLRTKMSCFTIENAHEHHVRDLDYNPNKQYYLASSGDDCKVKFWDIRNTKKEVKVLSDHSHWVWSVRFNHLHDQFILSASSDSRVILSNTMSISSEAFGALIEEKEYNPTHHDGVIKIFDEHEESVYAAEWSSAVSCIFASISYDGRVVINRIPRSERFKVYFEDLIED